MTSHAVAKAWRDTALEEAGVRYAWVITDEWFMDPDWDGDLANQQGTWKPFEDPIMGPFDATPAELVLANQGTPFRLDYDGDGPALRGRMWASDAPEDASGSEAAFAPKDDFGEGAYGAVWLFFQDPKTNDWVEL